MNSYLQRLTGASAKLPIAESRLLLLTGQSSFASSALSPAQHSFLQSVSPAECSVTQSGFPYDADFAASAYQEAGLLAASWRNLRQVYWTLSSPNFVKTVAGRLQMAINTTPQRLILITGSCGLQLANAAWPLLRVPPALRVDVVALGPACFGPLQLPPIVIQGRRDPWSRLLFRGHVDHICECGHLDYWESAEVRALVRSLLL